MVFDRGIASINIEFANTLNLRKQGLMKRAKLIKILECYLFGLKRATMYVDERHINSIISGIFKG
ncbi:MAG: hypothetical protein CM15mP127_04780 [Gammaproteobacteria bacterium]|nr:MAG: hypothetical protein CM15mP127_04780 [Gammaproteobacteria bacterium]